MTDLTRREAHPMPHHPEELFRSTAPYYARYRAGYPPGFFADLATRFGLNGSQTVLDLGCGTGQVALPLAPLVRRVIAVDPEPTMLEEGARLAAEQSIANVDWRRGDSTTITTLGLPPDLDLATMGASFHWMDRDQVLRDLDALITGDGAVVVVSGGAPGDSQLPDWAQLVIDIRTRYLGTERRAGSGTYRHPEERHAEVLRHSAFAQVETVDWTWEIERTIDEVIGLQFSYSFSAPALFGDRKPTFERDLRAALTKANPDGWFSESVQTEALIARR
ncbi:MAG: class I SAM-dependent methyltransferase [Dermatophilaceae bacterium]